MWCAAAVAQGMVLVARAPDWLVLWPLASAIADQAVIFAGPVVAAGACAITQRRRQQWSMELGVAAPREAWQQRAAELASLALVAAGVAVTGHGIAWAAAALSGATGELRPGYLLLTTATLVLAALVGYCVGRGVRYWLAVPVTAVIVLLTMIVWPTQDLPFWYVINGWPQLTVSPSVLAVRWLWVAAVAGALVVGSRRHVTASAVATALAVVVTVAGMNAGSPLTMAVAKGQVCTDGDLTVCLWPDNAVHLPDVSALADTLVAAVAGTIPLPDGSLVEEGLATGHPEMDQGSSAVSVRGGTSELVFSMTTAWIDQFPSCPDRGSSDEDPRDHVLWSQWVLDRVGDATGSTMMTWDLGDDQATELAEVHSWSEADQVAWATERAERAQRCG